jgi:hypothetical protein
MKYDFICLSFPSDLKKDNDKRRLHFSVYFSLLYFTLCKLLFIHKTSYLDARKVCLCLCFLFRVILSSVPHQDVLVL